MDTLLDPHTGSYAGNRTSTLANAVYLRLATPLGSWWADPSLGSRLHELQRAKDLSRIDALARQYAKQALEPLLQDGRASRIVVDSLRPQPGWLVLLIAVTAASGVLQTFRHPFQVVG
ncbi:phage GP46 family protein [Aquitalea aquatica]|uniref:Phage GP46 family protein n=1 Tax=Aquitalea aquatica TaxID=3044273 RepID=A0A838Y2B9_9NEIS|nr:phage GP46 family protein [Aquitalea magnusonii]MBA4709580.1 phage GP46 family protein [Aquitalea magnusonii]